MGLGLLIIFTNPALFHTVCKIYEPSRIPIEQVANNHDAIILLGGFSNLSQAKGLAYAPSSEGNRLTAAMELYHAKKARKIIISGGAAILMGTRNNEALEVQDFLIRQGVNPSDIIVEPKAKNTYENAIFTKKILTDSFPNPSSILVTSSFHIPRAKWLFEKQGVQIFSFPSGTLSAPMDSPQTTIVPDAQILWKWRILIKEWVGVLTYKLIDG